MRKHSQTLIKTNPYLKNAKERELHLIRSVVSSSAIEGTRAAACRAMGVKGNLKKAKVSRFAVKSA